MAKYYLLAFLISFSLGIFFVAFFNRISAKYKILTNKGIPHIGGISMGVSLFIVCSVIFFILKDYQHRITAILIPSLVMLVFGIIDDKKELSVRQKLLFQVIAASLLILLGIKTKIIYIGNIANIVITLIWVIGITNAFNHLDILDGLAAGTIIIVTAGFFIISILNSDILVSILTIALIGIVLSFLMRNLPPAKIFMGNAGSHFLGFILSVISIDISYATLQHKIALLAPIFILWFPIFDTAFVVLMRLKKGRSALLKSDDHLALRFLKLGYSKNKTLLHILLLVLFFTLTGVAVSQFTSPISYLIVCLMFLVSTALTIKMGKVPISS